MTKRADKTELFPVSHISGWTSWLYRHDGKPDGEIYQPDFWMPVQYIMRDGDKLTIEMPATKDQIEARVCRNTRSGPIYLRVMGGTTLIMQPIRDHERDALLREHYGAET